jgi:Cu-Zn family superoxide dismutase
MIDRRTALKHLGGAALISLSLSTALAHAASQSAQAKILNAQGTEVGSAKISSTADGVKIAVKVSQLTPGQHGIHIHTVGKCEGPAFASAGGHFNPTSAHHGVNNTQDPHPHLGDLQNLTVASDGKGGTTFMVKGVTLGDGSNSLFHDGGTSLVIHAKADDLMSDPSGNSGDRVACGVIEK